MSVRGPINEDWGANLFLDVRWLAVAYRKVAVWCYVIASLSINSSPLTRSSTKMSQTPSGHHELNSSTPIPQSYVLINTWYLAGSCADFDPRAYAARNRCRTNNDHVYRTLIRLSRTDSNETWQTYTIRTIDLRNCGSVALLPPFRRLLKVQAAD